MPSELNVAIVGGGPAGLAAYAFIKKHCPDAEVKIYEPHEYKSNGDQRLGGGYGIAPNGGSRRLYINST